ncbi:MAG: hypothetical protein R6V10_03765 [bacterium]
MKHATVFLSILLLACLSLYGCAEKKTGAQGPPQEVSDALNAARSAYEGLPKRAEDREEVRTYQKLMDEARKAVDSGDYDKALDKALSARLVVERLHTQLVYEKLKNKYNAPSKLTYHVRQEMSKSKSEEEEGNVRGAIQASVEARQQAEMGVEYEKQCLQKASDRLSEVKSSIEKLFRPSFEIIELYWRIHHLIESRECGKAEPRLNKLERLIRKERETTIYSERRFEVHASEDYVKKYGKPAMFESVSKEGLVKVVNRVRPGEQVIFKKSLLYTPSRTYYLVKDPKTSITGWMAEMRVWPERARRMKKLGDRYGS